MAELKPCPFCGGIPEICGGGGEEGYFWVYCFSCGAEMKGDEIKEKAIEAWNRRAEDGS